MHYSEIKEDMKVDYHPEVGGPATETGCMVSSEPWMMNGNWYCLIDSRDSAVLCEQLSLPGEKD